MLFRYQIVGNLSNFKFFDLNILVSVGIHALYSSYIRPNFDHDRETLLTLLLIFSIMKVLSVYI